MVRAQPREADGGPAKVLKDDGVIGPTLGGDGAQGFEKFVGVGRDLHRGAAGGHGGGLNGAPVDGGIAGGVGIQRQGGVDLLGQLADRPEPEQLAGVGDQEDAGHHGPAAVEELVEGEVLVGREGLGPGQTVRFDVGRHFGGGVIDVVAKQGELFPARFLQDVGEIGQGFGEFFRTHVPEQDGVSGALEIARAQVAAGGLEGEANRVADGEAFVGGAGGGHGRGEEDERGESDAGEWAESAADGGVGDGETPRYCIARAPRARIQSGVRTARWPGFSWSVVFEGARLCLIACS